MDNDSILELAFLAPLIYFWDVLYNNCESNNLYWRRIYASAPGKQRLS